MNDSDIRLDMIRRNPASFDLALVKLGKPPTSAKITKLRTRLAKARQNLTRSERILANMENLECSETPAGVRNMSAIGATKSRHDRFVAEVANLGNALDGLLQELPPVSEIIRANG